MQWLPRVRSRMLLDRSPLSHSHLFDMHHKYNNTDVMPSTRVVAHALKSVPAERCARQADLVSMWRVEMGTQARFYAALGWLRCARRRAAGPPAPRRLTIGLRWLVLCHPLAESIPPKLGVPTTPPTSSST